MDRWNIVTNNLLFLKVEMCRMPALAIMLTLENANRGQRFDGKSGDVVAFVSGLLLGNDQQVRNWFASFVRSRQKVRLALKT